jgi:hypothetical protein
VPAQLIDAGLQTLFPPALPLELLAFGKTPQAVNQQAPIDQKCTAGLVTTEAMQQFDRPAAPQSEQVFDDSAIDYRGVERFQ